MQLEVRFAAELAGELGDSTLDRDGLAGATELSSLVRRLEVEEGKIAQLRADLSRLRQRSDSSSSA